MSAKCAPYYPACDDETELPQEQPGSTDSPGTWVTTPDTPTPTVGTHSLWFGNPSNDHVLYHAGYVLNYDDVLLVPSWVCYTLTADDLKGNQKRTDDFRADPDLEPGKRSELIDYKGSDFDRGHMAPAADMKRNKLVMSESFLLSNMAPQLPNFNRGIWSNLESRTRDWAQKKNSIDVCTGPGFDDDDGDGVLDYETIGPNHVAVPEYFFKIIMALDKDGMPYAIAFLFEHRNYASGYDLAQYITTIDAIEEMTGLDFFNVLDDSIEEPFEASPADHLWY